MHGWHTPCAEEQLAQRLLSVFFEAHLDEIQWSTSHKILDVDLRSVFKERIHDVNVSMVDCEVEWSTVVHILFDRRVGAPFEK